MFFLTSLVKKGTNEMGLDFLNRVFKTSVWLSVGLAVIGSFYFGLRVGIDFGVAALWGSLGFKLLHLLLVEATRREGARFSVLLPVALGKLLLYGVGLTGLLLFKPGTGPLLAGLSLILAVLVLKVLGRALIDSEWFSRPVARREGP
jgi:hypothetical protein